MRTRLWNETTKSLLAEVFPDVPHKRSFGPHETLLAIEKARKILGYEPKHSWRAGKTATYIRGIS